VSFVRGHFRKASQPPAATGIRLRLSFANPKSINSRPPSEHDVPRLDIAMDDPLAVCLIQGIRKLDCIPQNFLDGQCNPFSSFLLQRLAFKIFEYEVVHSILVSDVMQRANAEGVRALR